MSKPRPSIEQNLWKTHVTVIYILKISKKFWNHLKIFGLSLGEILGVRRNVGKISRKLKLNFKLKHIIFGNPYGIFSKILE